jgi:hypothetical protein
VEYERTAAFLGSFLDIGKSKVFVGPIYHTGLAFATRKNAHLGIVLGLVYFTFCLCTSTVKTGVGKRFLASMPSQRAPVLRQKVNTPLPPAGNVYPESLEIADDGLSLVPGVTATHVWRAVPIYDAREAPGFDFHPEQLLGLKNLPRWDGMLTAGDDLEADKYITTVGYTANTFPAGGKDTGLPKMPGVLFNVMFVIVLGFAA